MKDKTIAAALSRAVGTPIDDRSRRAVSGGSVSQCWRYETARGPLFVKTGTAGSAAALECEAAGLTHSRAPKLSACRRS